MRDRILVFGLPIIEERQNVHKNYNMTHQEFWNNWDKFLVFKKFGIDMYGLYGKKLGAENIEKMPYAEGDIKDESKRSLKDIKVGDIHFKNYKYREQTFINSLKICVIKYGDIYYPEYFLAYKDLIFKPKVGSNISNVPRGFIKSIDNFYLSISSVKNNAPKNIAEILSLYLKMFKLEYDYQDIGTYLLSYTI